MRSMYLQFFLRPSLLLAFLRSLSSKSAVHSAETHAAKSLMIFLDSVFFVKFAFLSSRASDICMGKRQCALLRIGNFLTARVMCVCMRWATSYFTAPCSLLPFGIFTGFAATKIESTACIWFWFFQSTIGLLSLVVGALLLQKRF